MSVKRAAHLLGKLTVTLFVKSFYLNTAKHGGGKRGGGGIERLFTKIIYTICDSCSAYRPVLSISGINIVIASHQTIQ